MANNGRPFAGMRMETRVLQRLVMTPKINRVPKSEEEIREELLEAFRDEDESEEVPPSE